ncbi:MAG: ParB/RepB/Spo0J family partition protein, partial [Burkholderia gladioli]
MGKNAFGNAAAMLGGLDQFYAESDEQDVMLDLTEIHVKEQVRTEFEDGEHSIQQMADSMTAHGQIQAILVRPMPDGGYELVAGERRYRGAKLLNWTQIRARIRQMTDEQAEDIQYAENVHRKNLTQAEEAKKLARDLEKLGGDRAALCAKHNLTKSYVSKILAVLDLQTQGQRLLNENITSDLETINSVRRLEKQAGPEAAQEVVDEL